MIRAQVTHHDQLTVTSGPQFEPGACSLAGVKLITDDLSQLSESACSALLGRASPATPGLVLLSQAHSLAT